MNKNPPVPDRSALPLISMLIALVWSIGFTAWFHALGLPNNPRFDRSTIWTSLPYNMLDLIDPPISKPGEARWGLLYLFQRTPFLLIAIAIWTGAWCAGSNGLRMLKIRLRGCEHFFFSGCLGLSCVSLVMLLFGLCGVMSRWPLVCLFAIGVVMEIASHRYKSCASPSQTGQLASATSALNLSRLGWIVLFACSIFVLGQLLGAMSPQVDFDVVEYHLGGPKEWFQQGRIARLPHNVYTSFPFLTEMLILTGMVIYGDWQWGALAGQAVIAGFAPLTAIGLVAAGRRFFSDGVGWIAALIYLTSPWTYRISIIAYAEGGLSCYLFASLYAALLYRQQIAAEIDDRLGKPSAIAILAGLLAGSAMACKYTGLVSAVIPIGLLLVWTTLWYEPQRRIGQTLIVVALFSAGVLCTIGPWLMKNAVETGNPVYPLAVRIFGGTDRDEEIDAKWRRAHAATSYASWTARWKALPVNIADVVGNNDWHSPLMFGFAPLSLLVCLRRKRNVGSNASSDKLQSGLLGIIWLYVAWQFFSWWLLTHHIDRFYVPMFSTVALLAGVGFCWCEPSFWGIPINAGRTVWRLCAVVLIAASILYNANVMLCLGGFNAGRMDLTDARDFAEDVVARRIRWMNNAYESGRLPANTKILCVGEALLFHARYPYLYNTVFDHSLFERLCKDPGSADGRMRPADEIRAELQKLGITHIDVNWSEILRYREPGNYGYTDFVHPDRFVELQRMGVLGPQCLPAEFVMAELGEELQARLEEWAPSLITTYQGKPSYIKAQLFQVLDAK